MVVGTLVYTILHSKVDINIESMLRPPSHALVILRPPPYALLGGRHTLAYLQSHVLVYNFADYCDKNSPIVSHCCTTRGTAPGNTVFE